VKILHFCPVGPNQGLGVPGPLSVALTLARSQGQSSSVWTTTPSASPKRVARGGDERVSGIDLREFRALGKKKRSLFWTLSPSAIFGRLPSGDDLIVHLHLGRNLTSLLFGLRLRVSRKRYLVQMHGMVEPSSSFVKKFIDGSILRWILMGSGRVLVLQEVEGRWARELGVPEDRVVIVPNAIAQSMGLGEVRNYRDRRHRILFVGHLRPKKNVMMFYEIAGRLAERDPMLEFVVAGPDGGDLGILLGAIERNDFDGKLAYAGVLPRQELIELANDSLLVVSPAMDEPFNLSVLDCMIAATPAVVSDNFHNIRLLLDSGSVARAEMDVDSFVSTIEGALVEDMWISMSASAKALTLGELCPERVAAKVSQQYLEICVR
jgi:glycosyltransferase involved in cell wall biosynthesis